MVEQQKKKVILVAEDDHALRRALVDSLSREKNFTVLEATDGEQALEKLKERPDLVLLDIAMPKENGLAVYEEMENSDWGKNIKVIFLTNSSSLNEVAFAQKYGPVDYLVKSDWSQEEIIKKIKERLQ